MSMKKQKTKSVKLNDLTRATGILVQNNTANRNNSKANNIPNNSWDDVNRLSSHCGQLLLQATGLRPALSNKTLMEQVEDVQALNQSAHILARDLKSFADEIVLLRSRHSGKSGNASNQDENMEAIDIYMSYAMFAERFEANILPVVMHMVEIIHTAEAKLREIDNDAADQIGKEVSDELEAVKSLDSTESPTKSSEPISSTNLNPNPLH